MQVSSTWLHQPRSHSASTSEGQTGERRSNGDEWPRELGTKTGETCPSVRRFPLSIFQPWGPSEVICLALKLAIVPPSIIGWPDIDRSCSFSFQLTYIAKKGPQTPAHFGWPALQPVSAKVKRTKPRQLFSACVMLLGRVVPFTEIKVIILKVTRVERL